MAKLSAPLSIEELVLALELDTIQYYELGARLFDGSEDEPLPADPQAVQVEDIATNWAIRTRHEGKEFGVRVRAEASNALGVLVADVAVEYVSKTRIRIQKDAAFQFVNDVALMQVYPYVREAFTTLSTRVFGQGVVMPVVQRGQIRFAPPKDAAEVSEG